MFKITVTRDGEMLDQIDLDGFNLTKTFALTEVGHMVAQAMGTANVAECAMLDEREG